MTWTCGCQDQRELRSTREWRMSPLWTWHPEWVVKSMYGWLEVHSASATNKGQGKFFCFGWCVGTILISILSKLVGHSQTLCLYKCLVWTSTSMQVYGCAWILEPLWCIHCVWVGCWAYRCAVWQVRAHLLQDLQNSCAMPRVLASNIVYRSFGVYTCNPAISWQARHSRSERIFVSDHDTSPL